jgi:hypothetical protein
MRFAECHSPLLKSYPQVPAMSDALIGRAVEVPSLFFFSDRIEFF